jgi:putative membrane protein
MSFDRRPRAFRLDEAEGKSSDVPLIEMVPDAYEAEALMATADPQEQAVEIAQKRGVVPRSLFSWGGLFWSAASGLVSLAFGLWLSHLIEDLFARSLTFGVIGLVLAALAVLALLVMAGREFLGIARQRRIAELHIGFAAARTADDTSAARKLLKELASLYAARPETARARKHLADLSQDIVDGRDLIDIAETALMEALDREAQREIALAAKRVSVVTTIAPRAIIDVLFVAAQAIRLMRRIAEIYGGRPGLLGFLKLARSVGAHLTITGGMAAGDSLLQQVVGHGLAAKVSARLGEGVLNGLLTTRVGLSAMAVCRPMPFATSRAPGVRDVAPFLFSTEKKPGSGGQPGGRWDESDEPCLTFFCPHVLFHLRHFLYMECLFLKAI